ncbi:MAG: AAA family ATPase [Planctomycetes bacterium]|nr:AAA family ATPase [Planctomycetota bacterium]
MGKQHNGVEEATRAVLVPLDEVEAEATEWLWPGRIPLGKVTLLSGESGVGKSLVALDIAARVSRGGPWPGATASRIPDGRFQIQQRRDEEDRDGGVARQSGIWDSESGVAANVVLLTPGDDLARTVRPRLAAAGADPARVCEVRVAEASQVVPQRAFALVESLGAVRHAVGMLGGVRLVVVDPVEAFAGRGGRTRGRDVDGVLWALGELAEASGAAVLAVARQGVGTAAGAAWAVMADAEVPNRRLLMPIRSPLCAAGTGLAFRVGASPEQPRVEWEPGAVRAGAVAPGRLTPAAVWLWEALGRGPLASRELGRRARGAGLSWASMRRAKRRLGVTHHCMGFHGAWLWRLPGGRGQGPCGAQVSESERLWPTLGPDAENRPIRN